MINDRVVYSCSDDDGAWSSVDKRYTDPAPQSVAVQPDEQCDKISRSASICLVNCWRLTVLSLAQCHVCQHWHKPIIPSRSLPQPCFPFSEEMINHFQKIQQELKPLRWAIHLFTSVLRSREALHSPLELSSTGFLFSRDSPVVYKSFTEISRSQMGGARLSTEH